MSRPRIAPYKLIATMMAGLITSAGVPAFASQGWVIQQSSSGLSFDTQTRIAKRDGFAAQGLLSFTKRGGRELVQTWEQGSFQPTIRLDGKTIQDGKDYANLRQLSNIRLSATGSLTFLLRQRGQKAPVELLQDFKTVFQWPHRTPVKTLGPIGQRFLISMSDPKELEIKWLAFRTDEEGTILPQTLSEIGSLRDCSVLQNRPVRSGILINATCTNAGPASLFHLAFDGTMTTIASQERDVLLARGLLKKGDDKLQRGEFTAYSAAGTDSALHFYHAIYGALMSNLGEPGSFASDAGGRQSWSQTYRTTAIGELYKKVKHPALADLAINAMSSTLSNQNRFRRVSGKFNPACGWASQVYSIDKSSPVSLFVNQAFIASSLKRTCANLDDQCSAALGTKIGTTLSCLSDHYGKQFDSKTGLYRIAHQSPFRFDGIWAPWNWQLSMAHMLAKDAPSSDAQARGMVDRFSREVRYQNTSTLWTYWPEIYYHGWQQAQNVSMNRPVQKPAKPKRAEDISHAAITLMAICDIGMSEKLRNGLRSRLHTIMSDGVEQRKYLDLTGPRDTRWTPSVGWDCLGSKKLAKRFTHAMRGGATGQKLAAYARLFDPAAPFDLKLNILRCTTEKCRPVRTLSYASPQDFLTDNPFFRISDRK